MAQPFKQTQTLTAREDGRRSITQFMSFNHNILIRTKVVIFWFTESPEFHGRFTTGHFYVRAKILDKFAMRLVTSETKFN